MVFSTLIYCAKSISHINHFLDEIHHLQLVFQQNDYNSCDIKWAISKSKIENMKDPPSPLKDTLVAYYQENWVDY